MSQEALIESLTPRERQILGLVAEGMSLSEISRRLSRSLKTIESHRLSIGRKLKASNRVELTRIAIAQGLVSLEQQQERAGVDIDASHGPERELALLQAINQSVQKRTGRDYIDALCKAISQVLDLSVCGICVSASERSENHRMVLAMRRDGQMQPSFYYSTVGTPIPEVIERGVFVVEDGLAETYPTIPFYTEHGLCSYFGLRLDGDYGAESGVFAVVNDKPFRSSETVERVMRFFMDRVSAELTLLHKSAQIQGLKARIDQAVSVSKPPSEEF